ncbi:hypothetical protein APY04_3447 [Hyphomicrobium sulfonivorans]|uniref:Uncharacterized protein n=1 Tax=Hyphomicrobium sulfonivorans TaxID=121290 RepID=A0A125NTQ5_HYPSL|nr:hypothetical protein APY04_3447 [Hyphomicrobium sulfonivorans]
MTTTDNNRIQMLQIQFNAPSARLGPANHRSTFSIGTSTGSMIDFWGF